MEYELKTVRQANQCQGERIALQGHAQTVRRMGALVFIVLRDRTGKMQLVADQSIASLESLSNEQAVIARGLLVQAPGADAGIEMQLEQLQILSNSSGALPVEIAREKRMQSLGLPALLNFRPLTLRNEKVRAIFKIQAMICAAFRQFLTGEGFTEIHTPKIVSTGTEGGANLFALDYFGTTAFLAQSPQFYKQIMVGVFERVFEVGPVYRAEEHNTIRHLNEYISLDFEMGFIENESTVIAMETRLLQYVFQFLEEHCSPELALHEATIPKIETVPRVTLAEAREILLREQRQPNTQQAEKEDLSPEDERLLCEYFARTQGIEMVFVTHYPWHVRPFYAMPEAGTGSSHSFDLLFRGLEITTGGQRIHEHEMLVERMKSRGLQPESFQDYLQCFRYGMPPHGGLAIGLERLVKQLLGLSNIREAALFPRDRTRLTP